jgi:hypothetical protein
VIGGDGGGERAVGDADLRHELHLLAQTVGEVAGQR